MNSEKELKEKIDFLTSQKSNLEDMFKKQINFLEKELTLLNEKEEEKEEEKKELER